jgi:hypothetical protein
MGNGICLVPGIALAELRSAIVEYLSDLTSVLWALLPWAVWCVVWLGAVNWRKAWPMLAEGGWVPVVLLMIAASMAWAMIDARPCECLGFLEVPNGWWQLGVICTLAALALVCGWLQGYFAWTPPEISVEPPPVEHIHHDGHGVH